MEELKKIEVGMVPVYETSTGEKVVYGTELYMCLGSKRQYTDWVKSRLAECDAIAANERIYEAAIDMNEYVIGKKQIYS